MPHNYIRSPKRDMDALAAALVESWRQRKLDAKGENKLAFSGLLCTVDQPSDQPPGGANGHRCLIPRQLAANTISQLRNMPVNAAIPRLNDHARPSIVGVVQAARLGYDGVLIHGLLFNRNRPDAIQAIQANADQLGLSFEVADTEVESESAPVWRLSKLEWCGCSILARANVAYRDSWIRVG